MISLNGALYAVVGYMTFLGLFAPVIGVVRFWPGVFVPAVFAVLFGPFVGGAGAAIGIFLSDMVVHGNALLSLTVGVPANFVAFYLIGFISNRRFDRGSRYLGLTLSLAALAVLLVWSFFLPFQGGETLVWLGIAIISVPVAVALTLAWPRWGRYQLAVFAGNLVGSIIVGVGVWVYSQFFTLPGGSQNLPVVAAYVLIVFTFMNQLPFLLVVVPPVLKACYRAFPAFVRSPDSEGSKVRASDP